VLQQTPSAQLPEAHSVALRHVAPFIFGPQLPATHFRPATHASSFPQMSKHLLVDGSHENGAQTVAGARLQIPFPSQA
jgi:hypothetical protein